MMVVSDVKFSMGYFFRSRYSVILFVIILCFLGWNWIHLLSLNTSPQVIAPSFSNEVSVTLDVVRQRCYQNKLPQSIEDLHGFVEYLRTNKQLLCRRIYTLFRYVYQIRIKNTSLVISNTFMEKVKKWLNNNEALIKATKKQSLIFVDNLWTQESVVFNPVRAKRPGGNSNANLKLYVQSLVEKGKDSCDFCQYSKYTAQDTFGRLESKYSVIISNTFKIDKYHGMALLKRHSPLDFSEREFIDACDLVMSWFETIHKLVPNDDYRFMYWDILPKASASQIHPHIHLTVGDYDYYSKWSKLHKAALKFVESKNKDYWNTLLEIHNSLGLAIQFGRASVIAYLTPQKDFEVVIISQQPCLDFFRLVFYTVRTYMDNLDQYALSMGFVFPKLGALVGGNELPMMVRIVSRGSADMSRSDISSFDLFGTPNVNKDPFTVIETLRKSLAGRFNQKLDYSTKNLK